MVMADVRACLLSWFLLATTPRVVLVPGGAKNVLREESTRR